MAGIEIILGSFALGLAGSVHCAGMCGPIAISLPRARHVRPGVLTHHHLLYQVGRVLTYSVLGMVIGAGASVIRLAGLSRALSVTAGVSMLLLAASQLFLRRETITFAGAGYLRTITGRVQQWMRTLFAKHGALAHLGIGLANGLLPCGLVTTALLASLAAPSIWDGGMFMASFGLGTIPLLSSIVLFGLAMPCRWRSRIQSYAPALTGVLGLLIIVRGLGLGIPFLSPAIAQPLACCPH